MAFYAVQPKGEEGMWCIPEIIKLNLTTLADINKLEELRETHENVYKLSYSSYTNRIHAVVEGQLVSVWKKSSLKEEILQRAVEKRWSYEETMRALYDMKPSERRQMLETATEE